MVPLGLVLPLSLLGWLLLRLSIPLSLSVLPAVFLLSGAVRLCVWPLRIRESSQRPTPCREVCLQARLWQDRFDRAAEPQRDFAGGRDRQSVIVPSGGWASGVTSDHDHSSPGFAGNERQRPTSQTVGLGYQQRQSDGDSRTENCPNHRRGESTSRRCSIHHRPSDNDWIGRHHGTSRHHTTACDDAWPGIVHPARCGPARGPSGDGARPRNFVGAFVHSNADRAATPRDDLARGITIIGATLDGSVGGAVNRAAQHHWV